MAKYFVTNEARYVFTVSPHSDHAFTKHLEWSITRLDTCMSSIMLNMPHLHKQSPPLSLSLSMWSSVRLTPSWIRRPCRHIAMSSTLMTNTRDQKDKFLSPSNVSITAERDWNRPCTLHTAHCTHTEPCYATPSSAQCLRRYCETAYSGVDVPNSIRSQRLVCFTPFPASSGRVQI